MSRIDDALKRMAEDKPARPTLHTAEPGPRPSDGGTLDNFPRETRARAEQPAQAVAHSAAAAISPGLQLPHFPQEEILAAPTPEVTLPAPAKVEPATLSPEIDEEVARKQVVTKATTHIVVEQYRRLAAALHDAQ